MGQAFKRASIDLFIGSAVYVCKKNGEYVIVAISVDFYKDWPF